MDSWADIIPSTYREYFRWNPRFTGTGLSRVFSLSPTWLVDAVNTAGFLIFSILLIYLAFGRRWKDYLWRWQTVALIWVLSMYVMLAQGQVFLWHCGCAFYLWQTNLSLLFLAFFRPYLEVEEGGHPAPWGWGKAVFLLLLAFCVGIASFNFGGTVAAAVALLAWVNRRRLSQPKLVAAALACMALGIILVLVSPGNAIRLEAIRQEIPADAFGSLPEGVAGHIARQLEYHSRSSNVIFYVLFVVVYLIRQLRHGLTREDQLIIWGGVGMFVVSHIALWVCPALAAPRVLMPSFAALFVAALRLMLPLLLVTRTRWISGLCLCGFALFPLRVVPDMVQQKIWWEHTLPLLEEASDSGTDLVIPYFPGTKLSYCQLRDRYLDDNVRQFPNSDFARRLGVATARESRERCRYAGTWGGCGVSGSLQDTPEGYVLSLQFTGENPPASLDLWVPALERKSRRKWTNPWKMLVRWYRGNTPMTGEELASLGYDSVTVELAQGKAVHHLPPGGRGFKKPQLPVIWLPVEGDNPHGLCQPLSVSPTW